MLKSTRYKLHHGPYTASRFNYGQQVEDETRGEVEIVGLTNAKIPWPTAKLTEIVGRKPGIVVYKGLAKAVRFEAASTVAYWWGVTLQTVTQWRRMMSIVPTLHPVTGGYGKRLRARFHPTLSCKLPGLRPVILVAVPRSPLPDKASHAHVTLSKRCEREDLASLSLPTHGPKCRLHTS